MSDDRFRDAVSKNLRGEISADDYFDALHDEFFTPVSFGFRKRNESPQYRLTADEKHDAIERAEALHDELPARREQKLHEGVGYEWSAVQAYAHEFAAEQIREFIADLACEFGGHIPDMTNVNLGAILARLDRLASTLEAEL